MAQKIIKIGSSVGITLPQQALEALGVKAGDSINLEVNKDSQNIIVTPLVLREGEDAEFSRWTKNFLEKYGDALKDLADR